MRAVQTKQHDDICPQWRHNLEVEYELRGVVLMPGKGSKGLRDYHFRQRTKDDDKGDPPSMIWWR